MLTRLLTLSFLFVVCLACSASNQTSPAHDTTTVGQSETETAVLAKEEPEPRASEDHGGSTKRRDEQAASEPAATSNTNSNSVDTGQSPKQRTANHLAGQTSPYLRMHRYNPVQWYPWGPEALEKARRENKLIFLSVGYSSCHWCHVMERESFEDEEIAAFLNDNFVCIKVDREERPDVDAIYMLAVQILTQRGGWPMSVFLTPDAKPFFGGTYFPARDGDRPGATGFLTIIRRLDQLWGEQPETFRKTSAKLTEAIQAEMRGPTDIPEDPVDDQLVASVKGALAANFDDRYGGFGFNPADPRTPKFPESSNLWFLLKCVQQDDDADCLRMLTTTLDEMARGGIWDHIGGGFHRYSVDRYWNIPHFEKMLYDNGQLLSIYSRAFQRTKDPRYRRIVDQTVAFLMREMRDDGGAFVAALDAESEQVEGKFYRWKRDEVKRILGEDYLRFASVYGLDQPPNFEDEYYVLQLDQPLSAASEAEDLSEDQASRLVEQQMKPLRAKLLAARNQRVRPLTDTKVLCSWNGLAIRGLADAGRYCDTPEYTAAAADAAQFVLEHLRDEKGRLLRTYTRGEAKLNAYLDDYAFLVDGLLGLYAATQETRWLEEATRLTEQQIALYGDSEYGGFYFTTPEHETLIVRSKQFADGAQPAGNSVSAGNLLRLSRLQHTDPFQQWAYRTVRCGAAVMERSPRAAPRMASALIDLLESQ